MAVYPREPARGEPGALRTRASRVRPRRQPAGALVRGVSRGDRSVGRTLLTRGGTAARAVARGAATTTTRIAGVSAGCSGCTTRRAKISARRWRTTRPRNLAFDRARETENRARIDLLTAEALAKMGSRREAWQRYHRALAALTDTRGVATRHAILGGASFAQPRRRTAERRAGVPERAADRQSRAQRTGRRHRRVSASLRSAGAARRRRSAAQPASARVRRSRPWPIRR